MAPILFHPYPRQLASHPPTSKVHAGCCVIGETQLELSARGSYPVNIQTGGYALWPQRL